MAKKQMNPDEIIRQTTVYTFDFLNVPVEKYGEELDRLFHDPDFRQLAEQRNRLVKSSDRMRLGSSEIMNLVRTIQAKDRRLADMIFTAMVQANLYSTATYEYLSYATLLKYYVDYRREGIQQRVTRLSTNLDKVTFLADVLEGLLVDIKSDMSHIFNNEVEFKQFDTVSQVLKQLTGFFNSARSKDADTPDAQLYIDYADSINTYMEKRLKTYTDKYRKIHPFPPAYTEQNMTEALCQFFGTDKFRDPIFLKRTKSGGLYIDVTAVAFNIDTEQSKKLDKAVGCIPPGNTTDDLQSYAFSVTDAIMKEYKPHQ